MKLYHDRTPSKYIMCLDANNLYGWAMSQYLPCSGFKWLNKKIKESDGHLISKNSSHGFILEVDLEYPDKLHKLHNDYPLVSEKLEISRSMLSKFCSDIAVSVSYKS